MDDKDGINKKKYDKDGIDLGNFLSKPYQSPPPPWFWPRPGPLQSPPPEPLRLPLLQFLDNPGKRSNVYDTSTPPSSPPDRRRCPNPSGPTDRPADDDDDDTDVPSSLSTTAGQATNRTHSRAAQAELERIEPPPFPWATDRPAHIHPIAHLVDNGLHSVEGEVKCSRCGHQERMVYDDVRAKFQEVSGFINRHLEDMNDRAPGEWMEPRYPECSNGCGKGIMKPVVGESGEKMNWLFLFLGQTLGICKLDPLKWYCKQHNIHYTGAKDRVLYSSYISICGQLRPDIPLFQELLRRMKKDTKTG